MKLKYSGKSISWKYFLFHEIPPKLYFMKLSERKVSQCILAFMKLLIQGFIPAILMSVRQYKKLNLLLEFSNSIFIKFYFKAFWHWSYVQNTLTLGFFFYKLFIWPPDVKRPKSFSGLTPWTPTKSSLWSRCRAYSTLTPSPTVYNTQKLNLS